MADQATSAAGRSTIGPHPKTPAAGAPAPGGAPADPPAAASTQEQAAAVQQTAGERETSDSPGFGERGRMRRRLRFLRKARELAYRDLGGLIFEMQRLGERRDELVAAKLATLTAIDTELRALEDALGSRQALTILRESGIAACPRCAAIHGSEDRFCPSCGLAMESRAVRPIAAVAAPAAVPTTGAGFPSAGGAALPSATPAATAPALFAPPAPPTPAPTAPTPPPPSAPATASPTPARTAPAPPPTPAATPPPPPAAPRVTDERPTEIIRPADGSRPKDA